MLTFLLKRIFSGLLVLVSVIVLVSSIVYLAPVDPARLTFGQRSDSSTVEAKIASLGLDRSLSYQLTAYFADISPIGFVEGKLKLKRPYLRESYQTGRLVMDHLKEAVPLTIILALSSFTLALIFGISLGIFSSLSHKTIWDDLLLFISTLGISIPSYVSAIILALVFAFLLGPLTGLNIQGSLIELNDLGDEVVVWKNLILPSIALGVRPIAIITQLTRSTMLDVLSKDYIRTARSKGIEKKQLIVSHAMKNAMNPVVTALTGWFASLLAGAFFVERVFSFKGVGDLTITALSNYDIPVLLACILFIALVFIILNILSDLINKLLDPKTSFT
jgi:peptide/nickel transport system permease protein